MTKLGGFLKFFAILMLLFSAAAHADLNFDQLTQSDVNSLNRDFSALMIHSTVSPAGGLLVSNGFEFGIEAGTSTIPNVQSLAARNGSTALYRVPQAGLIGLYSYSKHITVEAKLIPDTTIAGLSPLGSQSLGIKISFGTLKVADPVTALRLQVTNAYLGFPETVNNASTGNTDVPVKVEFSSVTTAAEVLEGTKLVASDLVLVEPFIGLGVVESKGRLNVSSAATASIFASQSNSMISSTFGGLCELGVQLHFFYTKLGFEYERVFDSDKATMKISFGY